MPRRLFIPDDLFGASSSAVAAPARPRADALERPRPPVPDTGWRTPTGFPNLSTTRVLGLDIETHDPRLGELGPGYVRPGSNGERFDGWICGVSVATQQQAWYFPIRHPDSQNVDRSALYRWLRDLLSDPRRYVVGANLAYDLGWLDAEGVPCAAQALDVQYAEPLLDEDAGTYSLESLAQRYLGEGKTTSVLYQWCADAFGGSPDEQRSNIWRTPAALVGPYAEQDALAPMRIIQLQIEQLKREQLFDLFRLEASLLPVWNAMYRQGVRVDLARAEQVRGEITTLLEQAQHKLDTMAGWAVNVNTGSDLTDAFNQFSLPLVLTQKSGKASFTKDYLKGIDHDLTRAVLDVRRYDKARGTFIDSFIHGHQQNGIIHAQYHPLRATSEEGSSRRGTVSGRLSCSDPNMQQLPSRDKILGPLIRSIYLPHRPGSRWRSMDYSQIEYRFLVHFAVGKGAEEARELYRTQPKTDFHDMAGQLIKEIAGMELERGHIKGVNFGLSYGMGRDKLRRTLGVDEDTADELFGAYHEGVPFVRATYEHFEKLAKKEGEIRTVLGRKRRFDLYVPGDGSDEPPLPLALARVAYGRHLKQYGTHKALNAELQGSSADQMKKCMSTAYYAGVFDVIGIPLVTVHDELGFDDDGSPEMKEGFREMQHIMETCVKVSVPLLVGVDAGANWAEAK